MVESFAEVHQGGDSVECVVCSDEPPSVKFEPCGHMIVCEGTNFFLTTFEVFITDTRLQSVSE